ALAVRSDGTSAGKEYTLPVAVTEVALSSEPGVARAIAGELLPNLQQFLEDPSRPKVVHDAKTAMQALARQQIGLAGAPADTMLYSYLLNATEGDHSIEAVVRREFGTQPSGSLMESADWGGQLAALLEPRLREEGLERIYSE